MQTFHRFRVWPVTSHELDGVWAFGRNPNEAAEEAFLDFIALDDPPTSIELYCSLDGEKSRVVIYPGAHAPIRQLDKQPEFSFA